jgi:hypothetical protein
MAPMATQKPDSPSPLPDPAPRSEALEAELATLEAILSRLTKGSGQPSPVDPPEDRGDTR